MQVLLSGTYEFEKALEDLCHRSEFENLREVEESVREILHAVRTRGDAAILDYTERWDGIALNHAEIEVPAEKMDEALASLEKESRECLDLAVGRIRKYHEYQRPSSWQFMDEEGNILGQKVMPLDRVGVYVPGGLAAYPSSVLMNVLPAKVAGVSEIFLATPPGCARTNPAVLAAARLAGVDRAFQIGGAQAIAALAYGTQTIPAVDKIVGPGNLFVTTAKRLLFGRVDIDMIAGPSEVVIVTDGSGVPIHLAADLLAQAEHDEHAVCVLISTSRPFADRVLEELEGLVPQGPWQKIASISIGKNGRVFIVENLGEATELVNRIAPEHLELAVHDPEAVASKIRNAGAIFLGSHSAETLGDYVAGPNHVLPTMGTARFFSPLGVYDFMKRSSIVMISPSGLARLGPIAARMATLEGLHAHAKAIEVRLKEGKKP